MKNQDQSTKLEPKAKQRRERLITIRLEADQLREMARQMATSGRTAQADEINEALRQTGSFAVEMPVEEAVRFAIAVHQANNVERAEAYYRAILKSEPKHPRANHFLGVLLHRTMRSKEGLAHVRRSLVELAEEGWAWNNLGNILMSREDLAGAEEAYRKAVTLDPFLADAQSNYAMICRHLGRLDEAEKHADQAISLNAKFPEALVNRGKIYMARGNAEKAMEYYSRALVLQPPEQSSASRRLLAFAHLTINQFAEAAAIYREMLEIDPDDAVAQHMLVACLGEDVPERAPDAFVTQIFDTFAESFDGKLARLGYRAPGLVVEALESASPPKASFGIVADAGCGTGLCGPLLRKRAKRLIGVDLSAGMLAKAKERGGYDELHEAELTAFLLDRHGVFDTIISADTLCYFGVVDGFVHAAHGAMKPGGVLVFTVEASAEDDEEPYRLQMHGRYSHRRDYIQRAIAGGGFTLRDIRGEALRKESGKPVAGWVVSATRD